MNSEILEEMNSEKILFIEDNEWIIDLFEGEIYASHIHENGVSYINRNYKCRECEKFAPKKFKILCKLFDAYTEER